MVSSASIKLSGPGVIYGAYLLLLLFLTTTPAGATTTNNINKPPLQDLHYREVLFHYYQQDYFNTIIHMQASRQQQHLQANTDDLELLAGGIYLSYGMHQQAQEIFHALLEREEIAQKIRNRAWFYLGKIAFQHGHLSDAEQALNKIQGERPDALNAEYKFLLAEIYLAQQRDAEAAAILSNQDNWTENNHLRQYASYNRGIALLRLGEEDQGREALESVTALKSEASEMLALKDKANLTLGYRLLQHQASLEANTYLEKIRLDSPFSDKALLGVGWANAQQNNFERALLFWENLRLRHPASQAVQESLLATPFAYREMNATARAAELYEDAIKIITQQQQQLATAIEAINRGSILSALQATPRQEIGKEYGPLNRLADQQQSRYLIELLATHRFQTTINNYLDLRTIAKNLNHWVDSIDSFYDMLNTRRQGYQQQLPVAEARLAGLDIADLQRRYDQFKQQYDVISKNDDAIALANVEEHDLWMRLLSAEQRLNNVPAELSDSENYEQQLQKLSLLKGVMQWQMDNEYKGRLWQLKKGLQQLEKTIQETAQRKTVIKTAITGAPDGFEGFEQRIDAQHQHIERLQQRLSQLLKSQGEYIQAMAVKELQTRQFALQDYLVQARFALAEIYDQASNINQTSHVSKEAP